MPVDNTGVVLAIAIWIGGTVLTWRRVWAALSRRRAAPADRFGITLTATIVVSVALLGLGAFVAWLYDQVTTGA